MFSFLEMSGPRVLVSGDVRKTGEYQSGQMGQTVNLLVYTFGGSNPSSPTILSESVGIPRPVRVFHKNCGSSSVGRALAFQAKGRGFEPRLPLKLRQCSSGVERFLGKEEVESSNLSTGSAFFVYNTH